MSLVARHLEANGIATVIVGSAIDIVEYCGVPRYLHNDFPLGNSCGRPFELAMQLDIMRQALSLFHAAKGANTTARTSYQWDHDDWPTDYSKIDDSNREELRLRGEARRAQQAADKAAGIQRSAMIADG